MQRCAGGERTVSLNHGTPVSTERIKPHVAPVADVWWDIALPRSVSPTLCVGVPWRSLSTYLHPDESLADYDGLKDALLAELAPQDIIETLWAEDVVSLVLGTPSPRALQACDAGGTSQGANSRHA